MALSVQEASAAILGGMIALPLETVPLPLALGRVLGEEVRSTVALPPWDNASMDGYAVRAEDLDGAMGAEARLPVSGTVAAGAVDVQALAAGTAMRIMTGAPVPPGADSVIRVEDTDGGVEAVVIRARRDLHANVRPRGQDLAPGDVAVAAGTRLRAAHLGVLASVGSASVAVHREPRVAVLTTGDELVRVEDFAAVERGERIVSSNAYTLAAAVTEAGGVVVDLGIAHDDPASLYAAMHGARGCDLLITSGGVSVGAYDFTKDAVQALGGELRLWRVAMRPGAPIGFGMLGAMPWLGLPGNPVSSMVTFELFARPLIKRLRGEQRIFRRAVPVTAAHEIRIAPGLTHFLRAVVEPTPAGYSARLTGAQGSGLLTSMARANALLIVPPTREIVGAGESLSALWLDDTAESSAALPL
jgi:molybdopterin molybdotransferase